MTNKSADFYIAERRNCW